MKTKVTMKQRNDAFLYTLTIWILVAWWMVRFFIDDHLVTNAAIGVMVAIVAWIPACIIYLCCLWFYERYWPRVRRTALDVKGEVTGRYTRY